MPLLTEQELNAPGGMSTAQGGYMSGYNPALNTPAQTQTTSPASATTTSPTSSPTTAITQSPDIGSELTRIKNEALGIQDILNQRAADEQTIGQSFNSPEYVAGNEYIDTNLTDQEIRDIERRQLRLFQKEIDATNQVYDQLLNEARMEGQGRLGSQRAMAARGGLLGSDFGASQKSKVQAYNTDVNRAIQAERQAKIGNIMGQVRSAVLAEKTEKRQAKQQGAENYLEWLKGEATRKQNNINLAATALLTQGLNPAEMDENELAAIATEAGTTVDNLIFQYQQLANEQAALAGAEGGEFGFMSTSGGIFRTDPVTGEAVFIPSGGAETTVATGGARTSTQTSTQTQDEISGFDQARTIITENPNLTDSQLKERLLESTDLDVTEINTLIDNRETRNLPVLNDTVTSKIVTTLRDNMDYKEAVDFINAGVITSGGKQYNLTDEQKTQLQNALDEARGFWEKLIPGGN